MNLLEIEDLHVRLGGRKVVDGVSISIGPGEFVGLIGPNGAGKTTLLKAVANLLPSEGRITLSGKVSPSLGAPQRASLVSYLPQERELNWPLPVEAVVALGRSYGPGGGNLRLAAERAAVDSALSQMGVLHLRHRPASQLSGGELARVLIARALAQDAPLLMADEPAAGLDPAHQISLMERLRSHAGQGLSVIACLHEIPLAARWCHRVIILQEGRIVADGAPGDVLTGDVLRSVYGVESFRAGTGDGLIIVPTALSRPDRGSS